MIHPANPADPDVPSRRAALHRLFALAAAPATALPLFAACGGGGSGSDPIVVGAPPAPALVPNPSPPPPAPAPTPSTDSLARLKSTLAATAPSAGAAPVAVSQGEAQSVVSSFGSDAQFFPPLPQSATRNLATIAQVWGYRRDLWTLGSGASIASEEVVPVSRDHLASSTQTSHSICGLHFNFDGQAFEVLMAGSNVVVTLIADGRFMSSLAITTTVSGGVAGAPLANPNAMLKFDFGSRAARRISLYARSSQGPCAIVVAAGDTVTAWDRSGEASFGAMTDSYGGAPSPTWAPASYSGGPFWEAAGQLGIPHLDLDAIGGTGYAPNDGEPLFTLDKDNAFDARLGSSVAGLPDLFVTSGGLNDNNAIVAPPYATADDARAGFQAAVTSYFTHLRASLPNAVLVATGPWQPVQHKPTNPVERAKADTIRAALQAAGGPWIFIDNLDGGWISSAGVSTLGAAGTGPWQTGTGNVGARTGTGNGDQYVDSDGTHPTAAGVAYLGGLLASYIRAAVATL